MSFDEIVKSAIIKCKSNESKGYPDFSLIYPFTTENISLYLDEFTYNNKSLLTVGSSLDQVFNASLMGCKDIIVVDYNMYIKYYYNLKKCLLLLKTRDELFRFLSYKNYPKNFINNSEAFNIDTYKSIRDLLKELDYESYSFFEELYKRFNAITIRKSLFTDDEFNYKNVSLFNRYLDSDINYSKTRNNIIDTKVSFYNKDVLKDELNNKYDNIWLSNICSYLNIDESKELLRKFSNYLKENGKLLHSYLYETPCSSVDYDGWSDIYIPDNIEKLKKEFNIYMYTFTGVRGIIHNTSSIKDSVLIYKK